MAKKIQRNFSGGIISPFIYPMVNIPKRQNGLSVCENFYVEKFGAVANRPGLVYGRRALGKSSRLFAANFGDGGSYLIQIGEKLIYIYEYDPSGGLTEVHFEPVPFARGAMPSITQSGNVVVLAHKDSPTMTIERMVASDGTVTFDIDYIKPPPRTGPITYTASSDHSGTFNYNFRLAYIRDGIEYQATPSIQARSVAEASLNAPIDIEWSNGLPDAQEVAIYVSYDLDQVEEHRLAAVAKSVNGAGRYKYIGEPPSEQTPYNPETDRVSVRRVENVMKAETTGGDYFPVPKLEGFKYIIVDRGTGAHYGPFLPGRVDGGNTELIGADAATFNRPNPLNIFYSPCPGACTFFKQRLVLGGADADPEKVFFSRLGNFRDFSEPRIKNDDSPFSLVMSGGTFSGVKHLLGVRGLFLFSTEKEWDIGEDTSPTAIFGSEVSNEGSGNTPPVRAGSGAIMTDAQGRNVYSLLYSFNERSFVGSDISLFSTTLFKGRYITDWAYSRDDKIIWAVMSDGKVLTLTFVVEQGIAAWAEHDFGGKVTSVAMVSVNGKDRAYFTVTREKTAAITLDFGLGPSDGPGEETYIESLADRDVVDESDFIFLDSSVVLDITQNGAPSSSFVLTAPHLVGRSVAIVADGRPVANPIEPGSVGIEITQSPQTIQLDGPASKVVVGLPYPSSLLTTPIDTIGEETIIGRNMIIERVLLYAQETGGLYAGPRLPESGVEGMHPYATLVPRNIDDGPPLESGDIEISIPGDWSEDAQVAIRHIDPLPCRLMSIYSVGKLTGPREDV